MKKTNKIMILLTLFLIVLSGCSDNTTNEAEDTSEVIDCDKVFYDNTSLPVGEYDCEENASMIINACNNDNLI